MSHQKANALAVLVTALMMLATPPVAGAQSTIDEQQLVLAQIQTDKRAVVLVYMDLDDAQVAAFTPIYDRYQSEYKGIMDRAVVLIGSFVSNYDSMTDEAARRLLKEWFKLKADEDGLIKDCAGKMARVLPPAKVLRFVQIENTLSTMLRLTAVQDIPLAR